MRRLAPAVSSSPAGLGAMGMLAGGGDGLGIGVDMGLGDRAAVHQKLRAGAEA